MLDAGFSADADRTCQEQQIDAHEVWRLTRTAIAFNPYEHIESNGAFSFDEAFTEELMRYCRSSLGSRCVLENDSIRYPVRAGPQALYDAMKQLGPPMALQTAVAQNVGNLAFVLQYAVSIGANAVELPPNSSIHLINTDQLLKFDAALHNNPV
jgi:hypothetical protein